MVYKSTTTSPQRFLSWAVFTNSYWYLGGGYIGTTASVKDDLSSAQFPWSPTHSCLLYQLVVGQQQRYPTPVCSGPASECSPRCDRGSWAPLLEFNCRCSWIVLVSASPLLSSEGLCRRCCLTLFSSAQPIHLHHLRMMIVPMLSWLQQVRRWWLEMVSG